MLDKRSAYFSALHTSNILPLVPVSNLKRRCAERSVAASAGTSFVQNTDGLSFPAPEKTHRCSFKAISSSWFPCLLTFSTRAGCVGRVGLPRTSTGMHTSASAGGRISISASVPKCQLRSRRHLFFRTVPFRPAGGGLTLRNPIDFCLKKSSPGRSITVPVKIFQ